MESSKLILSVLLVVSAFGVQGTTVRSAAEVAAFKRENPCPTTGLRRGACPGFQVDHVDPLCMGGRDAKANMHWLSVEDHRFKTFTDVRACRKLRKAANTPALIGQD